MFVVDGSDSRSNSLSGLMVDRPLSLVVACGDCISLL